MPEMKHTCKVPYPTEFPVDEIKTLVGMIRQPDTLDIPCAIHCGWVIVGYGLSHAAPHTCNAAVTQGVAGEHKDKHLAQVLEDALRVKGEGSSAAVPWEIVLPLVFDLLRRWLVKS